MQKMLMDLDYAKPSFSYDSLMAGGGAQYYDVTSGKMVTEPGLIKVVPESAYIAPVRGISSIIKMSNKGNEIQNKISPNINTTGRGSVPPALRDPVRHPSKELERQIIKEQGGKCAGCGTPVDLKTHLAITIFVTQMVGQLSVKILYNYAVVEVVAMKKYISRGIFDE